MHDHSGGGDAVVVTALFAPLLLAGLLYLAGAVLEGRRGRSWPWVRTLAWLAGLAIIGLGVALPGFARGGFVVHMWSHLLVGMLAPLLLVAGSPVTLALRSLHVRRARQLARMLRSAPARVLSLPFVAAGVNVGGLWLLYTTDLHEWMQRAFLIHVVAMMHLLAAGVLLTAVVIPFDPTPHPASFPTRLIAITAVLAAHGILAKLLYAAPPPGVDDADGRAGALLMYYGGDAIEVVVIVILCARWYRRSGVSLARAAAGDHRRRAHLLTHRGAPAAPATGAPLLQRSMISDGGPCSRPPRGVGADPPAAPDE